MAVKDTRIQFVATALNCATKPTVLPTTAFASVQNVKRVNKANNVAP